MSIFRRRPRTVSPQTGTAGAGGAEPPPAGDRPAYTRAEEPARTGEAVAGSTEAPTGRYRRRPRAASAAAAGAIGLSVVAISRLVLAVAGVIALLIALSILLTDVGANPHNTIVKGIHEGANFFAGAFTGLVTFKGHAKREITVDWGIAAVVYLIVGAIVARAIAGVGLSGLRYERERLAS